MSNLKSYIWETPAGYENIIVVDADNNHVHIYEDSLGDWCDDDWSGDLVEGRKWYKIWRDRYGQPEVCGE